MKSKVRELRNERRWSQEELARRAGFLTVTTIRNLETGRSQGSITTLRALAAAFGVTVDDLLEKASA